MAAPETMRSFRLVEFGAPLRACTGAPPEPTGTEVLVRVHACGVCHSDVHLADGYFDLGGEKRMAMDRELSLPRTLGHEIVGAVAALGEEARGVGIGDRRIVFPWIGCGTCNLCAGGLEHLCSRSQTRGVRVDGGFSTHVLVPHPRYLVDYGDIPPARAATLACSGLTAYSALRKAEPVSADDPVLVIGAGGVGLAAIGLVSPMFGTAPLVADISADKRRIALGAGAAQVFDPQDGGAAKSIRTLTNGGVAAVVDFVGAPATVEFGLSVLRKAGRLVVVGLFGGAVEIAIPALPIRALSLTGSYVGSLRELREVVALAKRAPLTGPPLETRKLVDVQGALDDLRAGRIGGRVVVET